MRGIKFYYLVSVLILTALILAGCREEESTPTPDFVLPSPTVTVPRPTATATWTPLPTPTLPERTVESTDPPPATPTSPPTQTPIPFVIIEVLNSEDGQPVSGAFVRLRLQGQGYAATYLTLANGKAYFTGLVPTTDPYVLDINAVGFRPISVEITVTRGINELAVQLETGVIARITTEVANLRAGPGPGFDVVREVQQGQVFPVVGVSDNGRWFQVVTPDGLTGWVFDNLVEIEGDLSQFDVETSTPTPPGESVDVETPTPTISATTPLSGTAEADGTPVAVRPPSVQFQAQALYDNMLGLQFVLVQMGGVMDRRTPDRRIECEEYTGYFRQVIVIQTYKNIPENWVKIHSLYVNPANSALDTNRAVYLQCLEGGGQISLFNFRNARNGIDFSLERLRIGLITAEVILAENQPSDDE